MAFRFNLGVILLGEIKCQSLSVVIGLRLLSMLVGAQWCKCWYTSLKVERSGFKTWPVHCDVFLGKKICIQSLSPPRSMTSTCKLSGKPGEMLGGGGGKKGGKNLVMD